MKIELNEHASTALAALFWAAAFAIILSAFASCTAKCNAPTVKVEGNTVINAK